MGVGGQGCRGCAAQYSASLCAHPLPHDVPPLMPRCRALHRRFPVGRGGPVVLSWALTNLCFAVLPCACPSHRHTTAFHSGEGGGL